jgi:hypothetical protein
MSARAFVVYKILAFRIVSFTATLLAARGWFGDWHVSGFQIFLLVYCSAIHYGFEKAWGYMRPAKSIDGLEDIIRVQKEGESK